MVFCYDFKETLETSTDDLMKEVGRYFFDAFYDKWYRPHGCVPSQDTVQTWFNQILSVLQTMCKQPPLSPSVEIPSTEITTAFTPVQPGSQSVRSETLQDLHLLLLPPYKLTRSHNGLLQFLDRDHSKEYTSVLIHPWPTSEILMHLSKVL